MSRGAKFALGGLVAIVIIGGVSMLTGAQRGAKAVDVRMENVGRRDLVAAVTASGQIEAKTDVDISADVTARIISLHVKEGDHVKKDELLVELDQTQFKGAVDRGQATLLQSQAAQVQAQASRDGSKKALDRILELKKLQPGFTTDESVEQAQTSYDVAQANLAAAEANVRNAQAGLKEAQDNLDRTKIYSPIDGTVVRLAVEEGEVAVPGTFSKETGLLMRIADMSTILAKVKVDETDVVRLAHDDSVSVSIDAFPDTTFVGRVTKIGNSATDASSTTTTTTDKAVDFDVEVTLLNPPKDVKPDLSMTARIVTDVRKHALSIPIIALTARAAPPLKGDSVAGAPITTVKPGDTTVTRKVKEQEGVFVVQNGVAVFRPVKVGIAGDEYFEVLDGVKEGETLVSGTYQAIRDMKDSTHVKSSAPEVKKP
ncbi:MAG TPA: efflux RND transporter periplasmic adaptor subunit [Gemmatimonadales bacterium]|jgi:HlyD family secretion protein|nr:efflux RND transporter periplasmic adaptor subunit [Gemmatimonadales bacterium]